MIFSDSQNKPVAVPHSAATRWCALVFLLLVIVPVTGDSGSGAPGDRDNPGGSSFTVPWFPGITDWAQSSRAGIFFSFEVNFTGTGDETFPSGSELQMTTDLENATWRTTLVLDGVETPQPTSEGRILNISGWILSYPPGVQESLLVHLSGITPAVSSPALLTLVNITEIDSHNAAVPGAFIRRMVVVPGTGPVSVIRFRTDPTITPGADATIPPGGIVVWVNDDPVKPHCVMARDIPTGELFGGLDIMCIAYNTPFAVTFDHEGEYRYRTVFRPEVEGTITVTSERVAAFTAYPRSGTAPLGINFTDLSHWSTVGRAWFFGDETYREPWTEVNASDAGDLRIAFSAVPLPDNSIIVTGGVSGGERNTTCHNDTWRLTNLGRTWTLMNASPGWEARGGHTSVALTDGSIVLMGGAGPGYAYNDTWRSTDKGRTWTLMNASPGWNTRGLHTSVALTDGSIVLMGGNDGSGIGTRNDVWRSEDRGATWMPVNTSPGWTKRFLHQSVAMPEGSILLTGGYDGSRYYNDVWRSDDGGSTWTRVSPGAAWSPRVWHSSVALPDNSLLVIGGTGGEILDDVWRSADSGLTWTRVNASAGFLPANWWHRSMAMPDGSVILIGGQYWNHVWRFQPAGSVAQKPAHIYAKPGNYSVTLQVYNGTGYNRTTRTAYITVKNAAPKSVTGITPASGIRGRLTEISNLSGTGFAAGAAVSLNKTGWPVISATNVTMVSAKRITCTFAIPAGAPLGYRNIVVKNPGGNPATKGNAFLVKAPAAPTVNALDPATGPRGSLVTITNLSGTGFVAVPAPKVQLVKNGTLITAGNVTVVNGRRISCTLTIPAGAAMGAWHARVTNGDQQAGVKNGAFTVTG